jgi:hypothetical protein
MRQRPRSYLRNKPVGRWGAASRSLGAETANLPRPRIAILNAYPPEMEARIASFDLDDPTFTSEIVRGLLHP